MRGDETCGMANIIGDLRGMHAFYEYSNHATTPFTLCKHGSSMCHNCTCLKPCLAVLQDTVKTPCLAALVRSAYACNVPRPGRVRVATTDTSRFSGGFEERRSTHDDEHGAGAVVSYRTCASMIVDITL
jgi:hypothetical protein